MNRHRLAASTALAAVMICTSAHAQTAPAPAAPQVDPSQVAEIVVTATKRETSLSKTPIAISAFSQDTLTKQHVQDVMGLADNVPSLHFAQQGDQGAILLTMRGIGNDAAYTEVADPEVAIYIDGVYSPRAQGASALMYDMERVEVLRGPQGTLFGRNATVGAVSLTTAKPKFDALSANVEVVGGSYNRLGIRGSINIPITDNFAIRAAFITDRHDGYISYQTPPAGNGINPSAFVTSGKRYDAGDQKAARLSARWELPRFSWNLSGEYYKDDGAPILSLMQNPRPGQKFWSALVDTAPQTDRYSAGIRSNMNYDITDHIAVTYVAGWSRVGGTADSDADAGAFPPTGPTAPVDAFGENRTAFSRYDFWSHELQLKSTGKNAIDWILGGYYSHEVNKIRFDIDQRNGYRDGTFNWAGSFIQADREIDSAAAFGQAIWHATDKINLTGGLRFTHDQKKDVGGRNVTYNGGCPAGLAPAQAAACAQAATNLPGIFGLDLNGVGNAQDLVNQLNAPTSQYGNLWSISPNDTHGSWNKLTWLARADAQVTDSTLAYASVSTGFKSGNIEDGGLLAGPETLTNYEVGSKSRFFGGRATLNLAAYYSNFTGYQVNQAITNRDANGNIVSSSIVTTNAKGAKAYGFEAEATVNITRADRLTLAGTVQKTKLDDLVTVDNRIYANAPANFENLKGNELPHAPRFSATASYEHDFITDKGGKITPRGTLHYETSSWLSYFNGDVASRYATANQAGKGTLGTAFDKQGAYAKIDLSLAYTVPGGKYMVEAFTQNLTDHRIRTSSSVSGPTNGLQAVFLSNYEPPRTWGVRLRAGF